MSVPWTSPEVPTNQKCELLAAIIALHEIEGDVIIYTDSQYLVDGMNKWLSSWINRNWRTARKRPVKNRDYWEGLIAAEKGRDVVFRHVRGHSGIKENEVADQLANAGAVLHDLEQIDSIGK